MKQYLLFMLALTSVLLAHAQNPGIPYQATLLAPETQLPGANSGLIPLKNTDVCLRFTFKSASGTEYQETQTATTGAFGRIDLVIGNGTPLSGSFAGINWDGNPKTMEVDIDYKGLCANFEPLAINEFQYVPYAFFALNAGGGFTTPPTITATANPTIPGDLTIGTNNLLINVDDADSDPTNEIQNLTNVLTQNNNAGGLAITNLLDPTNAQDAATKAYVDNNIISISSTKQNLLSVSLDLQNALSDETGTGAVVFANSPTLVSPNLGTPAAIDLTNATGTAAALTAGTVTTNANLTGPVTSVGNATAIANGVISNAMLANTAVANLSGTNTGDQTASTVVNIAAGNIAATNVQTAINELDTEKQNLLSVSLDLQNALSDETGTGAVVFANSPTLVSPNLGTPAAIDLTNATGTAAALTAGTVTTNANLTGPVTSVGNATAIANGVISNAMLANTAVANLSGTNTGDQTASTVVNIAAGNIAATNVQTAINELDTEKQNLLSVSLDLQNALSDETGTGAVVFANSPTLVSPNLGTPAAIDLTNATGTAAALTAGTVTTNANLTGPVTSVGNATAIANGVISNAMLANTAVANLSGTNTGDQTASTVVNIAAGNIAATNVQTAINELDTEKQNLLSVSLDLQNALSDETGTGAVVFANSPTLVSPNLGTPAAIDLTNATGTAAALTAGTVTTNANLTGPVTSVGNATAIANGVISNAMLANTAVANLSGTNTGDQTASTVVNIAAGNIAATNVQTAINELDTEKQNLLSVSLDLQNALSDETGTGAVVFANSPTLVSPNLGTPAAIDLTNATGTAAALTAGTVTTNANLTGPVTSVGNATAIANGVISNAMLANTAVANLSGTNTGDQTASTVVNIAAGNIAATNVQTAINELDTEKQNLLSVSLDLQNALSDETGTGAVVFANSPTLVSPNLGTPAAIDLTNATGLPLSTGATGILALEKGGTGSNTALGARNSLKIFSGSYSLQSSLASAEVIQVFALTGLTELTSSSTIIFHSNKAGLIVIQSVLEDGDLNSTLESIRVSFSGGTTSPGDKVSYLIITP